MRQDSESNGRIRFVRNGTLSAETFVDAATGGIVEQNLYRGGKRLVHATFSYSRQSDSVLGRNRPIQPPNAVVDGVFDLRS